MAIFDIFEEVSEKAVIKSETGDARIFGVVVGEVVKTYSDQMPGRVCVSITVRDSEANVLKWARMAFPSFGESWGTYFLPEIGDQVLVAFDQGIIDRPYIIGCVAKDNSKFLRSAKDVNNIHKTITTKHGSTIHFEDAVEGDGEQDKIEIYTAGKAHEMILDNAKKKITLKEKTGKTCAIEMGTERGDISIMAQHKVTIKVGELISVTMNADTGKVSISASDVSVSSTGKMNLSGGGHAELSGAAVKVQSQGALSLESSGIVKIEGRPIKIG